MISGVDAYISNVSNSNRIAKIALTPWKMEVIALIKKKLQKCKSYDFNTVLNKPNVEEELLKLKK